MLKFILFIASESASIDRVSNNLSVFNIIEDIAAQSFPFAIPKITVTVLLSREDTDPNDYEGTVTVLNNTQTLHSFKIPMRFEDKLHSRLNIQLGGLPVSSPGMLSFKLHVEPGDLHVEYSIKVLETKIKPKVEQS